MNPLDYLKIIQQRPLNQLEIGIAMGAAIKDPEVKPTDYERLCIVAKDSGYLFSNTELASEKSS